MALAQNAREHLVLIGDTEVLKAQPALLQRVNGAVDIEDEALPEILNSQHPGKFTIPRH